MKRFLPNASARRAPVLVLAGATLLALPGAAGAVDTVGVTEQVSVNSREEDANGFDSQHSSISADGRYVAFQSGADNLVPDDTNNVVDVFVRDRLAGTTERVSVAKTGKEADENSAGNLSGPSISADGRYVAFESDASNLVSGDNNNASDVFVRDRVTGETTVVSVTSNGSAAGGVGPSISANGRYVGFLSDSAALGGTGFRLHTFVHDRQTGVTERITEAPDGTAANGDSAFTPFLSADGRFVYFGSFASNLVPVATEPDGVDAFLYDRHNDTMTAITSERDPDSFVTNHGIPEGMSNDGRYLTFTTGADGFITPDTNGFNEDAWLVDTQTGSYMLVSRNDAGEQANEISHAGPVSNDGNLVAFESRGTNMDGPSRFGFHIYLRDVQAGTTRLVSIPPGGGEFTNDTTDPSMTPDGDVVGFHNLSDVFVRDMRPAADLAVSIEDSPDPVLERDRVTYTVTVDNFGPGEATNVTIVDTLPADPTFVSVDASQGGCVRAINSNSGGVLSCDLGSIAADGEATVKIVLSPRREGTITNTATVRASQPDANTANNGATESTTVTPR